MSLGKIASRPTIVTATLPRDTFVEFILFHLEQQRQDLALKDLQTTLLAKPILAHGKRLLGVDRRQCDTADAAALAAFVQVFQIGFSLRGLLGSKGWSGGRGWRYGC
jgi:hypothetical protein